MRVLVSFGATLALAACATAPAPATSSAPAPAANTAQPSRIGQLLASAGRNDAATRNAVERALGEPDITRNEGAGVALTYRLESCALLLLFTADSRNEMRLAQAHPSARRAGEAAPSLDQCAAEAGSRR